MKAVLTDDGVALAYDERGSGEPVLFVHGLGLNRRRWGPQFEAVAAAGYRAVRFDLRGFGDSAMPPGPYDADRLVADLRTVVGELGIDRLHLVGHSLGGMIAQRFAVEHPDRLCSLTLASTTAHNGRRASAFGEYMSRISALGFDAAVEDPEIRGVIEAVLAQGFPDGGAPPLTHFRKGLEEPNPAQAYAWRATVGFSVKDDLHRIACPVLLLHGTADPLIPFRLGRWIHEALPGSTFRPLEGAGHSVQVERAEAFNEALLQHLEAASCA